jgi:hypothetical protein
MTKHCCECRDGEHDNYTEDVRLYMVREGDTNKLVKSGYLCSDHVHCLLEDGFELKECK